MRFYSPRIDNLDVLERIALYRARKPRGPSALETGLNITSGFAKSALAYGQYKQKMEAAREVAEAKNKREEEELIVRNDLVPWTPQEEYKAYEAKQTEAGEPPLGAEAWGAIQPEGRARLLEAKGAQAPDLYTIGGKQYFKRPEAVKKPSEPRPFAKRPLLIGGKWYTFDPNKPEGEEYVETALAMPAKGEKPQKDRLYAQKNEMGEVEYYRYDEGKRIMVKVAKEGDRLGLGI